jgi:nicotinamide-nucleotide amidase
MSENGASLETAFTENSALVQALASVLRERGETLSCAESCTGGLLSATFAAVPGVSDVYMGTIVAYSNRVKEELLSVPSQLLKSVGAVSLPVARQMATGVRNAIHTTWALSITGVAGPGGGSVQKPVGTVCFGIAGPGFEDAVQEHLAGSRSQIQKDSTRYALLLLANQFGLGENEFRKQE